MNDTPDADILLADGPAPIWPEGQRIEEPASGLFWTRFDDHPRLNDPLMKVIDRIFELDFQRQRPQTGALGGRKIHHVDMWGIPEATLINERARAMFREATGSPTACVDLSWANIYQAGDHIGPHAHARSVASVVYCVDEGEPDTDPYAGELFIVDPRLPVCCSKDPGIMTTPFKFNFKTGCMVLFPGNAVHYVAPYRGQNRPRITLAWNMNVNPQTGSFKNEMDGIPDRVMRQW